MKPSNFAWVVLTVMVAAASWQHRAIGFALANLPGLMGFGEFGVLEERRLGLRGRALVEENRLTEAITAFEASLAIDPRGEYRRDLALALFQRGDPAAAERELSLHIASFPRDALARMSLALLAEARGATAELVREQLEHAKRVVEEDLAELEMPAGPFPPPQADKLRYTVAELRRVRETIEAELGRPRP